MTNVNIIEDLTLVPVPFWWENPWVWIAAVVILAIAGYLFSRWLKSRPAPVPQAAPVPPGPPPHLEALRRLNALREKAETLAAYDIALECSDILRVYIEGRFALPIRYQTTREFLGAAQAHAELGAEPREELGKFLGFFDRIKFARDAAERSDLRAAIDGAERFVRRCIPSDSAEAPKS